jgi:hypothetical protein
MIAANAVRRFNHQRTLPRPAPAVKRPALPFPHTKEGSLCGEKANACVPTGVFTENGKNRYN